MAHNITSRRLRLIASTLVVTSLALGLGACGKPQANSNSAATSIAAHSPAKIRLGAAPSGSKMAAETSAMSSDVMRAMPVTYVYSGPATDLTAPAAAWQFPAGNKPTAAQVAALAKALGITGDVHSVPGDTSGSLMVGSDDYTKPSLTVSADAMGSWWYNPGTIATTFPDMPTCVPPDAGVAGVPDSTTSSGAATDPAISPIPEAVPMPCGPEPTPPANVPTADQAKTKALELFKQLGLDVSSYRVDATADQWGANVSATLLLDGVAAPLSWGIGFGAEGAIIWASGFSAAPERADLYPRIGIDAAVKRLQAGQFLGMPMGRVMPLGVAAATSGNTAVGAASEPSVVEGDPGAPITSPLGGDQPMPVEPMPVEPPPVDAVRVDPAPVDTTPITVTLTSATSSLEMVWGDDGTVWLLPGYAFTSSDGGTYTVVAVPDEFLDQVAPPTDTTPVPVDVTPLPADSTVAGLPDTTLPAAPASVDEVSKAVVGLAVDDATKLAATKGWVIRVARIDGVDQPLTMDYRTDRYDVAVDKGVISSVISNG